MFQLCLLAFWKVRQSCWSLGQWRRQWGEGGGGTVENVPARKQLNGLYNTHYWHVQAVAECVSPSQDILEEETRTICCLSHRWVSALHPTRVHLLVCVSASGILEQGVFRWHKSKICPETAHLQLLECTEVQWVSLFSAPLSWCPEKPQSSWEQTVLMSWQAVQLLLLCNCNCRTQTVVCTTWKSEPSRQSKSATFSTLALKTFKSKAQILHVCTSFIIITGVRTAFAAVVYTARLSDQQDRHTTSRR